ncbi:hypothetical protein B0H14DRAFT_1159133 [Mycena olivaceomarginata]|nr:hypothetical protein B0H14DRAFT_1159133 [Mycena olivaceomarginata]
MLPPQPPSIPPTSTGGILSPASSTSGSGPSSPYTPASASFHPSAFSMFPDSASTPTDSSSYTTDMGLGLDSTGQSAGEDYASAWAASSPWASTSSAGLTEGDFDIGRIPEIGWELGCAAFPAAQPSFPGSEFLSLDGSYEVEMGEFGEQALGGELDLHFGDLGMGELDEMLTDGY